MTVITSAALGGAVEYPTEFYDDFSGVPTGQFPSAQNWAISVGPPGADPNLGSQYYTANTNCLFVDSNNYLNFVVQAQGGTTKQQTGSGSQTVAQDIGNYASSRITTFPEINGVASNQVGWSWLRPGFKGFQATYGTLTVVARVYPTAGFWAGIWCYGTSQYWPACGEIDVMQNYGGSFGGSYSASYGYFNVVGPRWPMDYNGANWEGTQVGLDSTPAVINDSDFHTYTMQIASNYDTVTFKMDGNEFANSPVTSAAWLSAMSTAGYPEAIWPFGASQPLGIVMNVVVGNTSGGGSAQNVGFPSNSLNFPVTIMQVSSVEWTVP